jgi:hypothetical protein
VLLNTCSTLTRLQGWQRHQHNRATTTAGKPFSQDSICRDNLLKRYVSFLFLQRLGGQVHPPRYPAAKKANSNREATGNGNNYRTTTPTVPQQVSGLSLMPLTIRQAMMSTTLACSSPAQLPHTHESDSTSQTRTAMSIDMGAAFVRLYYQRFMISRRRSRHYAALPVTRWHLAHGSLSWTRVVIFINASAVSSRSLQVPIVSSRNCKWYKAV